MKEPALLEFLLTQNRQVYCQRETIGNAPDWACPCAVSILTGCLAIPE